MKCSFCKKDFAEKDLDESHDVPCYLFYFEKTRKERKHYADKYPRRYLCRPCHKRYEFELHLHLISESIKFSEGKFNEK